MQKMLAQVVGVVLTVVGVAGFFVSDTLLGFGINTLHNLVHLVTGLLGVWVGFSANEYVKQYNSYLGIVYLLVGIVSLVTGEWLVALLNSNMADNVLHLVLGVVLAGVGFFSD